MTRRSLSRRDRLKVWDATDGVCYLCGCKIQVGEKWQIEHPVAIGLGGSDKLEDLKLAHDACHKPKTATDTRMIRKADRQRAKHLNAKKPTSRPIPGSKASGWKKRMDGTVERR